MPRTAGGRCAFPAIPALRCPNAGGHHLGEYGNTMNTISAYIRIYGANKATQDLEDFGKGIKRIRDGADKAGNSMLLFGGAFAAAGAMVARTALNQAAAMEQTRTAFTTLMHSGTKATAMLKELARFSASTPFEFNQVTAAAKQLMAFGFQARDVIPLLRDLGDASGALGIGAEGLQRMIFSIGQMQARGKITGEEIRELSHSGVPVMEILAQKLGKTRQELQKVGDSGIKAADALRALREGFRERFGGGMEAQAQTFNGILSNLRDRLNLFWSDAEGTGVGDRILKNIKPAFKTLYAELERLEASGQLKKFAQEAGTAIAGLMRKMSALMVWFAKHPDIAATGIRLTALAGAAALVGGAFLKLSSTFLGVWGALAQGLPAVASITRALLGLKAAGVAASTGPQTFTASMAGLIAKVPGWLKVLAALAGALYAIKQRLAGVQQARLEADNAAARGEQYTQARAQQYMKAVKKDPSIGKRHGVYVQEPERDRFMTLKEWNALSDTYRKGYGSRAAMETVTVGGRGPNDPVRTERYVRIKGRPGKTVWTWKGKGEEGAAVTKGLEEAEAAILNADVPHFEIPDVPTVAGAGGGGSKAQDAARNAQEAARNAAEVARQARMDTLALDDTPEGRYRFALAQIEEEERQAKQKAGKNQKAVQAAVAAAAAKRTKARKEFLSMLDEAVLNADLDALGVVDTPEARRDHALAQIRLERRDALKKVGTSPEATAAAAKINAAMDAKTQAALDAYDKEIQAPFDARAEQEKDAAKITLEATRQTEDAEAERTRRRIEDRAQEMADDRTLTQAKIDNIAEELAAWYDAAAKRKQAQAQELRGEAERLDLHGDLVAAATARAQAQALETQAIDLAIDKERALLQVRDAGAATLKANTLDALQYRRAELAVLQESLKTEQDRYAVALQIHDLDRQIAELREDPAPARPKAPESDAERRRKEWQREWEDRADMANRALQEIPASFANRFVDALTGQKDAFKGFLTDLKRTFLGFLKDMIAAALKAKLGKALFGQGPLPAGGTAGGILGGLFGGGVSPVNTLAGGFAPWNGPGPVPGTPAPAPGAPGGAMGGFARLWGQGLGKSTVGGVFGAGVLGAMVAPLLFGTDNQSGAGGGIGAALGMALGGPVGGLLGGVFGGALGSLFKKKRRRPAYRVPSFTDLNAYALDTGAAAAGSGSAPAAPSMGQMAGHTTIVNANQTINNYNPRPVDALSQDLADRVGRAVKARG